MAGWDDDSPRLHANLKGVLDTLASEAPQRRPPSVEDARTWQRRTMVGLKVRDRSYVGAFRGEPALENIEVAIGSTYGVADGDVFAQLAAFESKLAAVLKQLDGRYPVADDLDADGLDAVIDLAAWAHAEWVRIHPFANGNGRTARIWANFVFMRYGVEPAIRLRPRPGHGYAAAGAAAMRGFWQPTAAVFRRTLGERYGTRRRLRSAAARKPSRRKAPGRAGSP